MHVSQITLRWDSDARAFDTSELETFSSTHEILQVFEHLFMVDGVPAWALLLTHRGIAGPRQVGNAEPTRNPRTELSADERALYEALRRWRNQRARDEGKPPYVLFTNNQMIAVARARPKDVAELGRIQGIGESRLASYGEDLVALV